MRVKIRETDFELDLTTFINLMIVLLSFLLISSVVREVSILQVNLPGNGGGAAGQEQKKPLVLEVILYKDRLIATDRQTGPLKEFPNVSGQHDYTGLNNFLQQIKQQYPKVSEGSILLEPDTPYDDLIHTMDAMRYKVEQVGIHAIRTALFPDIAIGDAPANPKGRS